MDHRRKLLSTANELEGSRDLGVSSPGGWFSASRWTNRMSQGSRSRAALSRPTSPEGRWRKCVRSAQAGDSGSETPCSRRSQLSNGMSATSEAPSATNVNLSSFIVYRRKMKATLEIRAVHDSSGGACRVHTDAMMSIRAQALGRLRDWIQIRKELPLGYNIRELDRLRSLFSPRSGKVTLLATFA